MLPKVQKKLYKHMLGATRIRLWFDLIIQVLFFVLLLVQVLMHPSVESFLYNVSLFGILLSAWQVLHAFYVVNKYKDWERKQYLYNMRQVLGYGLLTLGIGVFMLIISFGFLAPFFYFTLIILHWILAAVVLFLAFSYFIISLRRLYQHLYRPKSFWDL
jgi:hypothetical protein